MIVYHLLNQAHFFELPLCNVLFIVLDLFFMLLFLIFCITVSSSTVFTDLFV